MAKNRKYSPNIEQSGSKWKAQITRQVTSKKTLVSKEQSDFSSESEAKAWAEQQLIEFATTLEQSNQRHGARRKLNSEESLNRSARRAAKTLDKKRQRAEEQDTPQLHDE